MPTTAQEMAKFAQNFAELIDEECGLHMNENERTRLAAWFVNDGRAASILFGVLLRDTVKGAKT